ncbi:Hypothetical protein AA314_03240 [Archangium gephyra]|uniref:Uncharacterized protein n=1 Tax=Archangium gephyra TaxID=48 RepID=A0AAC8Q6G1_9BACT|nr:Hypothetical protein AA314_03240 [Archangium gephyra]
MAHDTLPVVRSTLPLSRSLARPCLLVPYRGHRSGWPITCSWIPGGRHGPFAGGNP